MIQFLSYLRTSAFYLPLSDKLRVTRRVNTESNPNCFDTFCAAMNCVLFTYNVSFDIWCLLISDLKSPPKCKTRKLRPNLTKILMMTKPKCSLNYAAQFKLFIKKKHTENRVQMPTNSTFTIVNKLFCMRFEINFQFIYVWNMSWRIDYGQFLEKFILKSNCLLCMYVPNGV